MKNSPLTIKISNAGRYSGEYPHKVAIGEKQDLDEWEAALRRVGKTDAVVELGHFSFGQLRYACENLALQNRNDEDWEQVEAQFKATMYPKHPMPTNGSLGISNQLVPEDSKIARDLHHTLMHKRGSNLNQGWNVYSSDEMQFSQEPKAKIEVL